MHYKIKNIWLPVYCPACRKKTKQELSYTRQSKHRPKRYVYGLCTQCRCFTQRIGIMDDNKEIFLTPINHKKAQEIFDILGL